MTVTHRSIVGADDPSKASAFSHSSIPSAIYFAFSQLTGLPNRIRLALARWLSPQMNNGKDWGLSMHIELCSELSLR